MAENGTANASDEPRGLESISTLILYPAFTGARIVRGMALRIWKGEGDDRKLAADPDRRKIEISLPIPSSDEECVQFYGRPMVGENSMMAAAASQASYGPDGDIRLNFAEAIEAGTNIEDDAFLEAQRTELEKGLQSGPKVRESKARENKQKVAAVDRAEKETGFSFDQQQLIFKTALETGMPMPDVIKKLRKEGTLPK